MNLFKWQLGVGRSGFELFPLIYSKFLEMDCYILRYRTPTNIAIHLDKMLYYRHYRLNITLKKAKRGGEMRLEKSIFKWGPINLFRPDQSMHFISPVTEGTKYVLSLGWLSKIY